MPGKEKRRIARRYDEAMAVYKRFPGAEAERGICLCLGRKAQALGMAGAPLDAEKSYDHLLRRFASSRSEGVQHWTTLFGVERANMWLRARYPGKAIAAVEDLLRHVPASRAAHPRIGFLLCLAWLIKARALLMRGDCRDLLQALGICDMLHRKLEHEKSPGFRQLARRAGEIRRYLRLLGRCASPKPHERRAFHATFSAKKAPVPFVPDPPRLLSCLPRRSLRTPRPR